MQLAFTKTKLMYDVLKLMQHCGFCDLMPHGVDFELIKIANVIPFSSTTHMMCFQYMIGDPDLAIDILL